MLATTMVRFRPTLLSFATASYHDWRPGLADKALDFRQLASQAGVSRVAFLRHGKTAPNQHGVDFDRLLAEQGREQAKEAGASFGVELRPYHSEVLVSPAPRTMETLQLFLEAAGVSGLQLTQVQNLYDGCMQPEGSQLFQRIGYAPLVDYLEAPDPDDQSVAHRVLGEYALSTADAILECLERAPPKPSPATTTLLVVGHAIYLPAAALGVAQLAGCEDDSIVLQTNTREAECYLIDIPSATVSYLERPSSKQAPV